MIVKERFKEAMSTCCDKSGPFELTVSTNIGVKIISFYEGEPEDMTFSRNLNDVFKISDLIKMAYNAGLNGESFEFIEEDYNEGESEI